MQPIPSRPDLKPILERAWVTSDHHWGHQRMNSGELTGTLRPAGVEALMIRRWLETIQPDEPVLHLGDGIWPTSWDQWAGLLAALPGREKLYVRGNHDVSRARIAETGWTVLPRSFDVPWDDGWTVRCVHDPSRAWEGLPDRAVVLHGHTHYSVVDDPRFANVCVERHSFGPVRLAALVDARIERVTA